MHAYALRRPEPAAPARTGSAICAGGSILTFVYLYETDPPPFFLFLNQFHRSAGSKNSQNSDLTLWAAWDLKTASTFYCTGRIETHTFAYMDTVVFMFSRLALLPSFCFLFASGNQGEVAKWRQGGLRWGQDGVKMAARWPKMVPCRLRNSIQISKMAPRWSQMASRWRQDGPRWCLVAFGIQYKLAKWRQDGFRWGQDGVKMAARWPKMVPRWPVMVPRWPNMVPR